MLFITTSKIYMYLHICFSFMVSIEKKSLKLHHRFHSVTLIRSEIIDTQLERYQDSHGNTKSSFKLAISSVTFVLNAKTLLFKSTDLYLTCSLVNCLAFSRIF